MSLFTLRPIGKFFSGRFDDRAERPVLHPVFIMRTMFGYFLSLFVQLHGVNKLSTAGGEALVFLLEHNFCDS